MQTQLAAYKCDTNEAICLKLVRTAEDLVDEETTFKPEFSHQLFENETVFGYKELQIRLYYSACRLTTLLQVKFASTVADRFKGIEQDDVEGKIKEFIPLGYCTGADDFLALLSKDATFKPFGELIHLYTQPCRENDQEYTYVIYKADMTCPGFREYHARLQTFLLWYIETASYIDVDDDKWNYFLLFENFEHDGVPHYAIVGYMTVYNYYAYPDKIRPRISQMLVLPPFQGQTHGAHLLEAVHKFFIADADVLDITAEDPSESFTRLRDFVDTKMCCQLPSFATEHLSQGFGSEMISEAQQKLKINKKQARRVYEIRRLGVTDPSNTEKYRLYRIDVKRRLNMPFQKNSREIAKMRRFLKPEELDCQLQQLDIKQQQDWLEKEFQEVVTQYRRTLERLAIA
uniref:Histone acetyltransferase type B catalytic subunit n=1 Tax=Eptatretus burgeri TaxID=7764 RepID=A0A8C4Q9X8_EPTBU